MKKSIREAYGEALVDIGKQNPRLVVLDADVSNSTRSILFCKAFPDRFYNLGIAEANMMSVAAGMATFGLIPFVNTFGFLATLRAGEQMRSQIAYSLLNVKVAGCYSGLSDFADGASHQSIIDVAIVRSIPNMTVIVPSDALQVVSAVRAAVDLDGPVYLRLSRAEFPTYPDLHQHFSVGKGIVIRPGQDLTIVVSGCLLGRALAAAKALADKGVNPRVIEIHTIKPIDKELILTAAKETGCVVTVEEHSIIGGVGSAVSELVAAENPVPVESVGIRDRFGESGFYEDLLDRLGMGVKDVINAAEKAIARKNC